MLCLQICIGSIHFQPITHVILRWLTSLSSSWTPGTHQGDGAGAGWVIQPHAADRGEQPQARHPLPLKEQTVSPLKSLSPSALSHLSVAQSKLNVTKRCFCLWLLLSQQQEEEDSSDEWRRGGHGSVGHGVRLNLPSLPHLLALFFTSHSPTLK